MTKITYEGILEDIIFLNNYETTIETSAEALEVISSLRDESVSQEDRKDSAIKIEALTGYSYNDSNESFSDYISTIIKSIKNFFTKVWNVILKLFKKIKRFILNEIDSIDTMIDEAEKRNLTSNESRDTGGYVDVSLPEFVADNSIDDKLSRLSYLYNKLSYVRSQTYANVRSYIEHIHEIITDVSSDKNFVPFGNELLKNVVSNYDNDPELSKILYTMSDNIKNKTLGSKSILGYDKNFYYIFAYKKENDNIMRFPYDRDIINIDSEKFNKNYLIRHLKNIKSIKSGLESSGDEFDKLNNLFKKILKDIEKSLSENVSDAKALPIAYYMGQITNVLPKLIKTTELSSVSMFKEYLGLLKQLHEAN